MGKGARNTEKYLRQKQAEVAQKGFDRKKAKSNLMVQITNLNRAIGFKEEQIESGVMKETRTVHYMPDGTAIKVDGYLDNNIKPKFLIECELTDLTARVKLHEEELIEIIKLEEENARKTTTDGDKGRPVS